jgi:saccharopine dehydrogenase (NAD+, L-lysine-forming)
MEKIVVLGGYGEMGTVIVTDLAETFRGQVLVVGRNAKKAKAFAKSLHRKNVTGAMGDSGDKAGMRSLLKGAKVLINATNYYSNMEVMGLALDANVNYIDLGGMYHMTKRQLRLNGRFKKKKLVAVLGCGSTPGITNILTHYGERQFDRLRSVDIAFADSDKTKYKQPFVVPYSMQTIFDEFTMKPAVLEKGRIHFRQALTGETVVNFPKPVGKTVCRYSLHSELATLPIIFRKKGLKECSFRGGWDNSFVSKTKFLIDSGFSDSKPVTVNGTVVVPRAFAVAMLNKFLPPEHIKVNDLEFLRVELRGTKNGKPKKLVVYCKTVTNKKHNIPAGSWDTGVPPSIVAQEIAKGQIKAHGVLGAESCITPWLFFKELRKRGITVFTRSS